MLQRKVIWLSRADLLGDPFEGSLSQLSKLALQVGLLANDFSEDFAAKAPKDLFASRQTMYVSCWHASPTESAAMWSQYGEGDGAVAVRTSFERLASGLSDKLNGGMVRYIDYVMGAIPLGNGFAPLLHKRREFEHEREFRIISWAMDSSGKPAHGDGDPTDWSTWRPGVEFPFDPVTIIEKIYVSPKAPRYLTDVVKGLVTTYAPGIPVERSRLLDDPE